MACSGCNEAGTFNQTMPSILNFDDHNSIIWLMPWQPAAPGLELELAKEVGALHPLFRHEAISVARRVDNDDVLF